MFRKVAKITTILLVLGLATVLTQGCHHKWRSPEKRAEFVVKKLKSELDLNESQAATLDKIKVDVLAKRKELKLQEGPFLPKEAVEELRGDKLNVDKWNKYGQENEKKMGEFRAYFLKKAVEFHAILTPEQRNKLADLITKFQSKFEKEKE
ncbi:putative lipoprotein [Leptospira fainei serovar Hurstbridge str. BUT 6]|uniref:Lipoprotein n=1 Tax=Leptospira fainei serovar Hurstbridge str. BUT 6 TaxID=1193011 RepID=S3V1P1_9LEPT|nr:Spy/CpxP family protein refolding chaperone [Leptospira fainei]EPG74509.1 putative lipoprotein [Leptospira fainei serovar Hurstbridge str. BUT 6]